MVAFNPPGWTGYGPTAGPVQSGSNAIAVRQTGPGATPPVAIKPQNGVIPNLGLIATVTGTVNYTVEITADANPSPTGNWNAHDTLVGQSGSANGNVAYAITGIRLVVNSGDGTVNLGIAQWPF